MWWGDRIRRERLYAMSELQRPATMSQRLVRFVKRISRILVAGAGECVTDSEDHAKRELTDGFTTLLGRKSGFTISPFGLSTVPSLEVRASYTLKRPDQNSRRYRYTSLDPRI
jgi:hypothetical protein